MIGTAAGAAAQAVLSARGPEHGVPQMVLSRLGFGYWGNVLPAGLNSITAGIGWFAVNSVSGTFALNTLTHLPKILVPDHHRGGCRSRSRSSVTTWCTPSSGTPSRCSRSSS